jgi:hypothetical protein
MLNTSEQFVKDYLTGANTLPAVGDSVLGILKYLDTEYSYDSKNNRIQQWLKNDPELLNRVPDLVISVFTTTLLHDKLTYQAICGMLNHKIKLDDTIDRVKTIAEVIAVISKTGLVHVHRKGAGENTMVSAGYDIHVEIPTDRRHELNRYKAQEIVSNYDDIQGSVLLGGVLNHHEDEICLSHLNRMNKIPLSLNLELLKTMEELPTFELDTPQKEKQWNYYKSGAIKKYLEVVKKFSNKVHLDHKYCTRGRTYAMGYYLSTQGTSFKKAIVQLYNKELVKDTL